MPGSPGSPGSPARPFSPCWQNRHCWVWLQTLHPGGAAKGWATSAFKPSFSSPGDFILGIDKASCSNTCLAWGIFSPALLTISAHHCHFSPKESEWKRGPRISHRASSLSLWSAKCFSLSVLQHGLSPFHIPRYIVAQGEFYLECRTFSMPWVQLFSQELFTAWVHSSFHPSLCHCELHCFALAKISQSTFPHLFQRAFPAPVP